MNEPQVPRPARSLASLRVGQVVAYYVDNADDPAGIYRISEVCSTDAFGFSVNRGDDDSARFDTSPALWDGRITILYDPPYPYERTVIINGPLNGFEFGLQNPPQIIRIGADLYERLNDPDTGEYLGGYTIKQ